LPLRFFSFISDSPVTVNPSDNGTLRNIKMKLNKTLIATLVAALTMTAGMQMVAAEGYGYGKAGMNTSANQALSAAETETMLFMREEEKLARDVYDTLYDKWQLPVFDHISDAEQKHTDRIKSLLQTYGIADPVTDDTTGVFVTPELSQLYQQLLAQGMNSRLDALLAGALVEETDIMDLQQAIANSTRPGVANVYNNLMRASRNHLRAFVSQIRQHGGTYVAQVMPQAEVDAIINSPRERGNGGGHGGQGRGQGGQGGGHGQGNGYGRGMNHS
jgi:hypothetical protein